MTTMSAVSAVMMSGPRLIPVSESFAPAHVPEHQGKEGPGAEEVEEIVHKLP
jgi:hypothetical protein